MLKRATARSKANAAKSTKPTAATSSSTSTSLLSTSSSSILFPSTDPINTNNSNNTSTSSIPHPNNPAPYSPPEDEIIERTRLRIPNAHVFKLPPKPTSGGWRGGDWRDKVWQGTLKVVERGDNTAVLLVDANEERNIFAVCPIRHNISIDAGTTTNNTLTNNAANANANAGNGVDRCIDSSRYFVLRIQNAEGRHMYIGLAFNERNDAFDFNTALEDSRREKEVERKLALGMNMFGGGSGSGSGRKTVDYTMKEGEKIHVSIPKLGVGGGDDDDDNNCNTSPTNEEGGRDGKHSQTASSSLTSAATRRREAKKSPTTTLSSSLPWSSSLSSKKGGSGGGGGGGVLKPSSKDTPSRLT